MSIIKEKKVDLGTGRSLDAKIEFYNTVNEMVNDCRTRPVRHSIYNMKDEKLEEDWCGVKTYQEALDLLASGYQPVVDAFKTELKVPSRDGTRFSFDNNIMGFAPVVPLALSGVPKNMLNTQMKPIKAKVLDVYYDLTANCSKTVDQFIEAGKTLLGAILGLEKQGYRFNLYAVQSYTSKGQGTTDILCIKIKSSDRPLDLKRMSYPLTHPSFFRVIGFDWQGTSPITRNIGSGRGRALGYDYSKEEIRALADAMFGNNATYISCSTLIDNNYNKETLKEMFTNVQPKK